MKIDKQIKQWAQMVNEAEGYHAGRQMPGQLLAFKHPKLGDIVGRLLTTFVNEDYVIIMFKNNDKIDYSMVKSDDVYVQDALKTSDPRYKYCPSDEEYDEAIKSFGSPDNITEDEKDGVRYGTDPIQASVDTVASDGIGQNEFQLEMSKLEQWLSDIGAAESYDDIKDDILSGTETTIHLSQPISTVTLVMPKPKH